MELLATAVSEHLGRLVPERPAEFLLMEAEAARTNFPHHWSSRRAVLLSAHARSGRAASSSSGRALGTRPHGSRARSPKMAAARCTMWCGTPNCRGAHASTWRHSATGSWCSITWVRPWGAAQDRGPVRCHLQRHRQGRISRFAGRHRPAFAAWWAADRGQCPVARPDLRRRGSGAGDTGYGNDTPPDE